ncbi:unnamed protein product, partial [Polarella glacialis]
LGASEASCRGNGQGAARTCGAVAREASLATVLMASDGLRLQLSRELPQRRAGRQRRS